MGYILNLDPYPNTEAELRDLIAEQAGDHVVDLLLSGDIGYSYRTRIFPGIPNWWELDLEDKQQNLWVTTKYLNSMDEWPNTVIMGNMCYSAANKVLEPEFCDLNQLDPFTLSLLTNDEVLSVGVFADVFTAEVPFHGVVLVQLRHHE